VFGQFLTFSLLFACFWKSKLHLKVRPTINVIHGRTVHTVEPYTPNTIVNAIFYNVIFQPPKVNIKVVYSSIKYVTLSMFIRLRNISKHDNVYI
jgi:hypothetical protein